jgi:ATP-dependent RNA helicase SUPV3L1/SUV3
MECGQGVYLAPLRLLALENYEWMNSEGAPCSLLTGEEEILVEGARLISCTVEKLNLSKRYRAAVVDEAQLLADPSAARRGRARSWAEQSGNPCMRRTERQGAAHPHGGGLRDELELNLYERSVPLSIVREPVELSKVREGDALVAFSKKRVIALADYLSSRGVSAAVIYGDLPPEVRKLQCAAFSRGERPVLVSTDAIGMGLNLPIQRFLFTEISKFDGEEIRPLTSQEVKQIAGRAGRLGIYDVGYVGSTGGGQAFLEAQLEACDPPVEQAIVGPSEAILSIGLLPLREKLALWSNREEALPYYRKMDVRDQLLVLDRIASYRLPEKIQWQLIMLPFDVHSEARMLQFLSYVEACFVRREKTLPKPAMEAQDLAVLEGVLSGCQPLLRLFPRLLARF